jgi:Peptidase family M50
MDQANKWRLHGGLFLLTVLTTSLAWMMPAVAEITPEPPLANPLDYLLYIPLAYFYSLAMLFKFASIHPQLIAEGATFSASLLAILFSHEMGHYLACRYYKVNATLPYFIPAPPVFLAGTFGAFIKIRSPIPSRRALFDIGLAGPLAGFVVAIPLSVVGVLTVGPAVPAEGHLLYFNDPLMFRLIAKLAGVPLDPNSPTNPFYMAAWIGLLVTSLNLMPVGQLDGGHGMFALFGGRAHRIIGRVAFCRDGNSGGAGLLVTRQPKRLPLRGSAGNHDEDPPPSAPHNGTPGNQTNRDRHRDAHRLHPLLLAFSDHDYVATKGTNI